MGALLSLAAWPVAAVYRQYRWLRFHAVSNGAPHYQVDLDQGVLRLWEEGTVTETIPIATIQRCDVFASPDVRTTASCPYQEEFVALTTAGRAVKFVCEAREWTSLGLGQRLVENHPVSFLR